jgi:hypothetical protein
MSVKDLQYEINRRKHLKIALITAGAVVGVIILLILASWVLFCCGFCACLGGICGLCGRKRKAEKRDLLLNTQEYKRLSEPAPKSHPDEYGYQGKGHMA